MADHEEPAAYPLRGVVLCCTSIAPDLRADLAAQAERMGAVHTLDLTSEVTHLIVGSHETPKYKFVARERPDVKVVTEQFISVARDLWMKDEQFDINVLETEYARPVFYGLRICVTGFDDFELREKISRGITTNGGIYSGDLTKQNTHLIAARTEGAKYTHAVAWGLDVVSVEWFEQSIERGMILDERLYRLSIPAHERGLGAWKRQRDRNSPLGKRSRDNSVASLGEGKRKLRRTASTKLGSDSQSLWGDILGGGSFAKEEKNADSQWDEPSRLREPAPAEPKEQATSEVVAPKLTKPKREGMFADYVFYSHGFDDRKTAVLHGCMRPYGANIADSLESLIQEAAENAEINAFLVVPHQLPPTDCPILAPGSKITTVTEWWIERCLADKTAHNPKSHIVGRPFRRFPIADFKSLTICSTGFNSIELLHAKKSVELLGAKYSEDFTPHASLLICNSTRTANAIEKMKYAREWKVPVVSSKWLWDSIDSGMKLDYHRYLYSARPLNKGEQEKGQLLKGQTLRKSKSESAARQETDIAAGAPRPRINTTTTNYQNGTTGEVEQHNTCTLRPSIDSAMPPTLKPSTDSSTATTEPLREILPPNSPNKSSSISPKDDTPSTIPTQPAPTRHREDPVFAPDVSTTISSLLRSRTTTTFQPLAEAQEGTSGTSSAGGANSRRKRNPGRILGRATSNASVGSTRASSVDSTAERVGSNMPGSLSEAAAGTSESLVGTSTNGIGIDIDIGETGREASGSAPPPATQKLQYEDAESAEYRERVMAKMMGEEMTGGSNSDSKKKAKERIKSVVGDTGGRQLRRRPGFR